MAILTKKFKQSIAFLALIFIISTPFQALAKESTINTDEYFKGIMQMIQENYKGSVSDKTLIEGGLKGMLQSTDQYSVFFNNQEAESFLTNVNGNYKGIGVMISEEEGLILITKVFPGSPAEQSGIVAGDKIFEVEGKNIEGKSSEEAASLIRGEKGTSVSISILRGSQTIKDIKIIRDDIVVSPVTSRIVNDIQYIKLDSFNDNTYTFISQELEKADKHGISKILLDLRDNPGGELNQAIAVARKFVPKGLITTVDYQSENIPDQNYYSFLENSKYKLVVLVNQNSASASEILAGAIQDSKSGTLVGTKTFGKAKVQKLMPILTPEAYAKYKAQFGLNTVDIETLISKYNVIPNINEQMGIVKLTVAYYYTPKGRMIDEKGLEPDIKIENPTTKGNIDINSISELDLKSTSRLNASSLNVLNAEKILTLLGYDLNKPDMLLDLKTLTALSKFQKDTGITRTRALNNETQKKLNEKLEELRLELDLQYAKGIELLNK